LSLELRYSLERPLRIFIILLVILITALIFWFRESIKQLGEYGYLGAFLVSLTSNATIILPVPGTIVIFALGSIFTPILIGLVAGVGASLGELSGYTLGYAGRVTLENNKRYWQLHQWMKRKGALITFVFSVTPLLPFDLVGMAAGSLRFPLWEFLLVCWLGRTILYIAVAFCGAWGMEFALRYLTL